MILRVVRASGQLGFAPASNIDLLIEQREILAFCRTDGWAIIGKDPVRERQVSFQGQGRRLRDILERYGRSC
ncbi:GSU3473 family protein [Geomesophilobacter sediminis]|uniref:GSU3473 family protein n=1 Tax=Geomesophilobacter sediminis TaxID=2798584 RepID=UPI0038B37CB2